MIPFKALPPLLLENLLHGSVGKAHLANMAREALTSAAQAEDRDLAGFLYNLGLDMLRAAWESDPLDGRAAAQLAGALASHPQPPKGVLKAAQAVASAWDRSTETPMRGLGPERAKSILEKKLAKNPGDPRLLRQVQQLALEAGAMETGVMDWGAGLMAPPSDDPAHAAIPAPVRLAVAAELRLCQGDPEQALSIYNNVMRSMDAPGLGIRAGECLFRLGKRDQSIQAWRAGLQARPWHVNLALRLHDVLQGLDSRLTPLPGRVAALLYTYNKGPDLDRALDRLAQADAWDRLIVLNNGSSDETASILDAWQDKLPRETFTRIDLHVNIGAPAARNWLMAQPETEDMDWLLYLDDDALVPSDWRERFGTAAARYPEAGVWGCKVADGHAQCVVQSADLHLRPVDGEPAETEQEKGTAAKNHIRVSELQFQEPDLGLFDYLRPCLSVTGCCHLFRTTTLKDSGGFDLRFSPSQFDDLDHDLRMFGQGMNAVYQGHLWVEHLKRSGQTARTDAMASGNAHGNMHKLTHKHSPEDILAMRKRETGVLLDDLESKLTALD